MTAIVGLGLVNWIATTILVESELTRPLRDWVSGREREARKRDGHPAVPGFQLVTEEFVRRVFGLDGPRLSWRARAWGKARYLVSCHLCTGTWVGLALAVAVPAVRPFGTGVVGAILAGLLFKATGHLVLEAVGGIKALGR